MADNTLIEWTDATWNPITGCSVVSPGCTNCYAMKLAGNRLKHIDSRTGLTINTKAGPVWNGQTKFNESELLKPLRWKRPRRIFVCAHGDLFAESVPDEWIDRVFAVMALSPQHTFQVLTKRAARMREYIEQITANSIPRLSDDIAFHMAKLAAAMPIFAKRSSESIADELAAKIDPSQGGWPLPNVWLGVSAEDQTRADDRIPDLLATPAAIRFVSAEPLLGPIDFEAIDIDGDEQVLPLGAGWLDRLEEDEVEGPCIDWIIVGGESGQGARPMHPAWPRQIRDQCASAGVAFFFKQWGTWAHKPEWAHFRDAGNEQWKRTASLMAGERPALMFAIGKKHAGRQLDGIEHNAMPEVRP